MGFWSIWSIIFGEVVTPNCSDEIYAVTGLPTLTHMAWFSRIWPVTHALTQLTNLLTHLKEITRILTQFYKIENNLIFFIIVTHFKCNSVYCFLAADSFIVNFIEIIALFLKNFSWVHAPVSIIASAQL